MLDAKAEVWGPSMLERGIYCASDYEMAEA